DQGIHRDAYLPGNLVGGLETNAVNVLGQPVRVVADLLNGALAISPVNAHGSTRADAVRVEKQHNVADDFLLVPRCLDSLPAFWADAVHIFQPGRRLLDNVK